MPYKLGPSRQSISSYASSSSSSRSFRSFHLSLLLCLKPLGTIFVDQPVTFQTNKCKSWRCHSYYSYHSSHSSRTVPVKASDGEPWETRTSMFASMLQLCLKSARASRSVLIRQQNRRTSVRFGHLLDARNESFKIVHLVRWVFIVIYLICNVVL